ncbi:MAG: immunity 17 family protein [Anaerolineae bacterium]|nr:immunity 17 family protein [Anaerolineae bacterium]
MSVEAVIFFLIGTLTMAGAVFNWDWFMEHRKARFVTKILGNRERARYFYGVFGGVFIILGVLAAVGMINLS